MSRHAATRRLNIRVIAARVAAATVFAAAGITALTLGHQTAYAGDGGPQPIDLFVPGDIQAGQTVPCTVTLAPSTVAEVESSHITIYSEPAGVVSYDGTVTGSTATVQAATSTAAPTGPVTVYVRTDGEQVVGTTVNVAPISSGGFGSDSLTSTQF